jgi:hypothetical protein
LEFPNQSERVMAINTMRLRHSIDPNLNGILLHIDWARARAPLGHFPIAPGKHPPAISAHIVHMRSL